MGQEKGRLTVPINEKPKPLLWVFLCIQHVFAMFGTMISVFFGLVDFNPILNANIFSRL